MTRSVLAMPVERFARSPELAALQMLDDSLLTCEVALLAAQPELAHGALDAAPRLEPDARPRHPRCCASTRCRDRRL